MPDEVLIILVNFTGFMLKLETLVFCLFQLSINIFMRKIDNFKL